MFRISAILLGFIGLSLSQEEVCDCGPYGDKTCAQQPFAVFHNGIYWAWASPCAGGCSQLPNPLPHGWRRATDAEFANHPNFVALAGNPSGQYTGPLCASPVFDPKHDHCDAGDYVAGYVTNDIIQTNWETLIAHDNCGCDEGKLNAECEGDADCPYCMKCCGINKICEWKPEFAKAKAVAEQTMMDERPSQPSEVVKPLIPSGTTTTTTIVNKPNYNYFGYIILIGVIAFILINNIFIGCWCLTKNKSKEQYEKCDIENNEI